MEFLTHLWLPILLSSAAVWIASAIIWMALPHHKNDWDALPDEKGFFEALDSLAIPPGNYGFPDCKDHARMKDPEVKRRWEAGQAGMIRIWGKVSMGRNMLLTFLVYLVVSSVIAYLGWSAIGPTAHFGKAMQVMGTAGVLAYTFAFIPNGIWFGQYPRAILMCMIDGVVYGLITGAIFAGLWPAA